MKVCNRDHVAEMTDTQIRDIEKLPESQREPGRHACACCAYLLGLQHGAERVLQEVEAAARNGAVGGKK